MIIYCGDGSSGNFLKAALRFCFQQCEHEIWLSHDSIYHLKILYVSNDGVSFFPGQASFAYFFLRGSFRGSEMWGAGAGVLLRVIGGSTELAVISTSGARLGTTTESPPKLAAASWPVLCWSVAASWLVEGRSPYRPPLTGRLWVLQAAASRPNEPWPCVFFF